MKTLFDMTELRQRLTAVAVITAALFVCVPTAVGQDETEAAERADEPDPFAIPEGSNEELRAFVQKMLQYRVPVKSREELIEFQKKRMNAVIEASAKIMEADPEEELLVFAAQNQFSALEALIRYDQTATERLERLIEQLEGHELPAIAKLPAASRLRQEMARARSMDKAGLKDLAERVLAHMQEYGADASAYSMVSALGRTMGYAGANEAGAVFYERAGEMLKTSDNPAVAARAPKLVGAARMLRLPGKEIEVFGKTPDGSEFNWASYRGKVVLVDFWASWCGPCIGELPNMKANLERYGDKGFEIVGINLDSKREAFEKCIEDKEITWTNLLADADGEGGWDHPMATYYGISAIPTAILVDQEGKVVSLRARGRELDQKLAELLGPVEEPEAEGDDK
jgi:thiol-disulfide isomerase/thioredoxin